MASVVIYVKGPAVRAVPRLSPYKVKRRKASLELTCRQRPDRPPAMLFANSSQRRLMWGALGPGDGRPTPSPTSGPADAVDYLVVFQEIEISPRLMGLMK